MMFCFLFQTQCVSGGLTRFGIGNKDALMPDCGVHYLWFAFVCFLIRSHPPPRDVLEGGEVQGYVFAKTLASLASGLPLAP